MSSKNSTTNDLLDLSKHKLGATRGFHIEERSHSICYSIRMSFKCGFMQKLGETILNFIMKWLLKKGCSVSETILCQVLEMLSVSSRKIQILVSKRRNIRSFCSHVLPWKHRPHGTPDKCWFQEKCLTIT